MCHTSAHDVQCFLQLLMYDRERVRGQGTGRALVFLVVPATDVLRPNGKKAVER